MSKSKDAGSRQFLVSLEELLEAGCHFGHQSRRWHPKMAEYIWNERGGVHIIDLAKTQEQLAKACEFVYNLTSAGKILIFVGTKRQAAETIEQEATSANLPFVAKRWLGGTLTNWVQLKKSINRMKDLESQRAAGELDRYTKREQVVLDREVFRLNRAVGGLRSLVGVPDAMFVTDVKREDSAIREARRLGITVIAIVDTNCNPASADIVIPANDDAIQSVKLISGKIASAAKAGKLVYDAMVKEAQAKAEVLAKTA